MRLRKKNRSRGSFLRSQYQAILERLEDRTVPSASWNNFGGNAQHTDVAQVAAQPINQLLWQVPLDMDPWGAVHYGDPVFTANNVVVVPIKVTWDGNNQGVTNFFEVGINDVTGAVLWSTAPMGSISSVTNNANDTMTITSTIVPGTVLTNGASVTLYVPQGDTAANPGQGNTTYQVSNVSTNGTTCSFTINVAGNGAYTGGGLWTLSTPSSAATSYIEPPYGWLPPDQPAYDPVTDRVYFPGPGGTIDCISNPDTATGVVTPTQEAFYGTSSYNANQSAYNQSIYINTPVTVDSQGNIFFGYVVNPSNSNPSVITEGGIARLSASGTGADVSAFAAVNTAGQTLTDDGNWTAAQGSALALSNDGSTLYLPVADGGYNVNGNYYNSYLVGLNSTTLAPESSVPLYYPDTGSGVPAVGVQTSGSRAYLHPDSTASVMVAPDGTVFFGVWAFGSNYGNGSRGFLLHFSGDLQTEYTPGAFGWDDTPSIVPLTGPNAMTVAGYTGSSSYLIVSKYNNYANTEVGEPYGGNGVNEIAILDPYASQPDPNYDAEVNGQPIPVMQQVMTFASPSPDLGNINAGDPDAVREWCTNGTAVDPATDSIYVNDEDGYTYQWNLGTDTISNTVEVSAGYGVPYTPTAIAPDGEVFSDNGGTLFALGGYANFTLSASASANPAVYGNAITFTADLASSISGPTPTGTVTFTAYAGANNALNYDTTPITLGTATVDDGVATLSLSPSQSAAVLLAAHYHVTANYSGDPNYSSGVATFVLPVLETATTSVSASANLLAPGNSVTLTATVTPNGTPNTVVENGSGSSSYWVPTGTVTFMDGSTVLGTVTLNPLENSTYSSTYLQQVTLTVPSLPTGTNSITATYSGDQNFANGISTTLPVYVIYMTNPSTQNGAVGDNVSLQIQASSLPSGDSWTYAATGLPSGLSINTSSGQIGGTITGSANTYSVSVSASDGQGGNVSQDFTWNVSTLSVTNPETHNGAVGDSLTLQIQSGGLPSGDSWTYAATGLPSGLSINTSSGQIGGTITGSANTYSVSVSASDGQGASASQSFTWNVSALSVTNPGTHNGAVGDSIALQIQSGGLPSGDSWTYAATGLPSGLSINTSSGQIGGTLTGSANTYSISVTASDGQGASASQSFTWNVSTLSVTNPGTHNGAVGDSVTLQIQSGGLPSGDSWTYAATGLPSGLSINTSSGRISGTITGSANTYSVSVSASDGQGASASQSFTWNVSTLSVTNPGTHNGAVGDSVALQIQSGGLPSGDSWTYAATGLPSGLSINTGSGQISGTITGSANTYSVSVSASDGQGASASQSFTWNVSTLSVTNPGTHNGAVGDSVALQIQSGGLPSGDSWTYAATGLPSGLSINTSSGQIGGTITGSANTYSVSLTASDGEGASASQNFAWIVSTLSVTDPETHNGAVGDSVALQIQSGGLPSGDSWTYAATGLPSGLSINTGSGQIGGTITGSANTYSVSVSASDGQGASASQSFTWNVSTLSVTNPGTHNGAVGDSVALQIQSGGLPSGDSWTYAATGLPSGLSINTSSGQIGGTITGSANTYSVSVTASDGQGASASQSFTWNVSTLSVTNPGTHNGAVGDSVALQIQSGGLPSGDSWTYAATGLPSGLSINTGSGQIGGTITGSANTYSVSVSASDGQGASASQSFTWNVSTLSVTNSESHNGAVGDSVTLQIQSGGLPSGDSWTYAATGLPSGLSINTSSGQISGTITGSANTYSVSVSASDGQGASASQSFPWNVSTLSVSNSGTQNGAVGESVSLQIPASGLPSGDTWLYSATGLPSGLSINTRSGLISGKISAAPGAYAVSVTAGDGQGASAEQNFTWNVGATTSTVSSRPNPSVYGHKVTFTATITPVVNGSGKPTGTVTFFDGTRVLHTVHLIRGKAKYTTSAFALGVGTNSITVSYSGSSRLAASTSVVLAQTVHPRPDGHQRARLAILRATRHAGDIHSTGRGESPRFGHPDANGNLL